MSQIYLQLFKVLDTFLLFNLSPR